MLNKILKTLLLLTISSLGVGFLAIPLVSATVKPLVVEFQSTPLFSEVNFLPNDAVMRWIKVTNNSGISQKIIIEAINVSDPNLFAPAFNLEIKEGTTVLFDNTLATFFAGGETFLSNLADGNNTTYDLKITFNPTNNNDYQGKTLNNFDLLVGFQGQEGGGIVTGGTTGGSTGGGGGGGAGLPPGLTIFNEVDLNTQETKVIITWQTNYLSTSRVIYAPENESHDIDLTDIPNYGYAHSTIEDSNKVTYHQVELTGLTPGTLYYYRVISHASPDTISRSMTFKTTGESLVIMSDEIPPQETPLTQTPSATLGEGQTSEETGVVAGVEYQEEIPGEASGSGKVLAEEIAPGEGTNVVAPSATSSQEGENNYRLYIWILLILNLIMSGILWIFGKNSTKKLVKNIWLIDLLLLIVPTIIWYPRWGLMIWLILLLVIAIIYLSTYRE